MREVHYVLGLFLADLIYTCMICRLMRILQGEFKYGKKAEYLSYGVMHVFLFLLCFIQTAPLIMYSIGFLLCFLFGFCYISPVIKKLGLAVLICFTFLCARALSGYLTGYSWMLLTARSSPLPLETAAVTVLINYGIMLLVSKRVRTKTGTPLPGYYWMVMVFIPPASVYMTIMVLTGIRTTAKVVFVDVFLLLINYLLVFAFDTLAAGEDKKSDKLVTLLKQENESYKRQLDILRMNDQYLRRLRHDYANKIMTLELFLEQNDAEGALEHVRMNMTDFIKNKNQLNTGILALDSIVNLRIHDAAQYGIEVKTDVAVPYDLNMEKYETIVIISGLMDYGVESVKKAEPEKRNFSLSIKFKFYRGRLFFILQVPVSDTKEFIKTEEFRETIRRYDGFVKINKLDSTTEIQTVLYLDMSEYEDE